MIIHEQLNVYKFGFGQIKRSLFNIILDKFLWDLKKVSKNSKNVLNELKDSHKGEKAVILCNGPSLLKTDFSQLSETFTFGLNKINLLFQENIDFRPNIICAFDKVLNQENMDFFKSNKDILKILSYKSYSDLRIQRKDLIYGYNLPLANAFTYNVSKGFIDRANTTFMAIQLAYHMGFEKVALIGADHNFPDIKPREFVLNEGADELHFHKDYHKAGSRTQNTDKLLLDMNFRDARIAFEDRGRLIVNATDGGYLEEFERMELESFLNS
ncbi:6-hydroxymethylpterin diphosphokinase MptE-like protein [Leeuwenhoekiella nanhaiensis]|uniref:6-hydroxymethylpterin diphosphokinase MptE-like domain-containing protein n=1 Tax=Leeuwenhoekiella nanhaiensis TaxID=1655491 RepID=A0A2G1VND2_9FLAO|nr:6-hydroxymethylpterin diphosphokinase MptE-like protein [Leeuwenhoekiella nanhaiensis]PHQ28285.1 hypothetical protein CJ305_15730 [Leeuwenhoekiella nanhaiensis]